MKKVLVIIPAYNEEKNILKTVSSLSGIEINGFTLNYIVINDGSRDDTLEICEKHNLNYVSLIQNLGIGGAVQTGYKYAFYHDYDIAIQFDGDGQHDANYIFDLVNEIEKGNDMVIGSRFVSNLSKFKSSGTRRIGIKLLSFIIRICSGKKIYDVTSGFRAINKSVIRKFADRYPLEYPEPETNAHLARNDYKIKEIPVEMKEREYGKSSINLTKSVYYMISVSLSIIVTCLRKEAR